MYIEVLRRSNLKTDDCDPLKTPEEILEIGNEKKKRNYGQGLNHVSMNEESKNISNAQFSLDSTNIIHQQHAIAFTVNTEFLA